MQKWMDGINEKDCKPSWDGLFKILRDIGTPKVAGDLKKAVENACLLASNKPLFKISCNQTLYYLLPCYLK